MNKVFSQTEFATDLSLPWRPRPFTPLFRNGHLQTLLAHVWPVASPNLTRRSESKQVETEPQTQVLIHVSDPDDVIVRANPTKTLLIVHGLTGSAQSHYALRLNSIALRAGYRVVRMNVRNCGNTEHLSHTLYHSGLTTDLNAVVHLLNEGPLYLAGFSMGGNMTLKLAGEWGSNPPPHVKAVAAVSVPVDLAACARRLGERQNRFYERRFLRELRKTVARKAALMPDRYSLALFSQVRSIIEFDHLYTAPDFGYRDAFDYYAHNSSRDFLEHIRLPALILQAQDDPFIPFSLFETPAIDRNDFIHLLAPQHGGHVGFISREGFRFWAATELLRFFDWVEPSHKSEVASPNRH
ncbi:MAG: alpha/beta fold hydrolase [Acidobacteriota bacterium]